MVEKNLFFQTVGFPQRIFETPALATTTKHSKADVNSRIDPDNNAITEWIEVTITSTLTSSPATIRGIFLKFHFKEKNI